MVREMLPPVSGPDIREMESWEDDPRRIGWLSGVLALLPVPAPSCPVWICRSGIPANRISIHGSGTV